MGVDTSADTGTRRSTMALPHLLAQPLAVGRAPGRAEQAQDAYVSSAA